MTSLQKNWDWNVELTDDAIEDFTELPKEIQQRYHKFIKERLPRQDHPTDLAEQLVGSFSGTYRYRIGDYRMLFVVDEETKILLVTRIRHRGRVYG